MKGWKLLAEEPLENAPILQQAAGSPCLWQVANDGHGVRITRQSTASIDGKRRRDYKLNLGQRILVGTDRGEYIGSLELTDEKGTPIKSLLHENVLQILATGPGVLIITGLRHLDADYGTLWLYDKNNDQNASIKKLGNFDGYPIAEYVGNDGIFVLTSRGVSLVDQANRIERVAELPLALVHPNSITQDSSGRVYIGMNAAVVRLVPSGSGYKHEWFVKDECLH